MKWLILLYENRRDMKTMIERNDQCIIEEGVKKEKQYK